jgi:NAD(P)-dependent dehydrogenase (short-subunit alcohol dehydrogenase family)
MLLGLQNKRAIVTGGASGIGLAICKALALQGVQVAVADIDMAAAASAAGEIRDARAFPVNVSDRKSVEDCFTEIEDAFGGYEILCANAGVSSMKLVVDLTDDEWNRNFDVNTRGVFLTNQAAVRHFQGTSKPGSIVNTASLAGKLGAPWLAHYSASKFAVVGFTQALAREVAQYRIRVNCVCPGFVRTPMQAREIEWEAQLRDLTPAAVKEDYIGQTPLGRLEEPEDVADAIVFLASDLARFITGEALNVTGGVRMD